MKFTDFEPFVLPHVPHVGMDVVAHNVKVAAVEFFARTLVWQALLDPITTVADVTEYDLDLEPNTDLAKLLSVWVGDQDYTIDSAVRSNHRRRDGSPYRLAWTVNRCDLRIEPAAAAGKGLVAEVAMKPSILTATEFPDEFGEFTQDIANGALGVLLSMPGEHMNLNLAQAHRAMFNGRIATVHARVSKGFSKARPSRYDTANFY